MSTEEFPPTVHCLETLVPELLQVSTHPSAPTQSHPIPELPHTFSQWRSAVGHAQVVV